MLTKSSEEEDENWDLFLNQTLIAVIISINETTRFFHSIWFSAELYYCQLIISRNLEEDTWEENFHLMVIEKQHSVFERARNRIPRTQKKRNEKINKNRSEI